MERVLPVNDRGEETTADVSAPVPLPVKRPPRVVEPVPPFDTVSAFNKPRVVEVALAKSELPVSVVEARLLESAVS